MREHEGDSAVGRVFRVVLGAGLVVVSTAPLYRLAAGSETGLAGRATVEIVETQAAFLWSGALIVALVGVLGGLVLRPGTWSSLLRRVADGIRRLSAGRFALLLAGVAFLVTLAFTVVALEGKPNLIDAMVQLVQARFMAEGRLAGPTAHPEFWFVQNTVVTDAGWVSQYPPGHAALLAVGLWLGAVELAGPVFMVIAAVFTYLALRRLRSGDELIPRLAGLGVALSPFLVSQAGSYMSHGSAAALSVLAVYFALRARDDAAGWALALGAALGLLVTSRPLFALVIAVAVVAPIAVAGVARRRLTTRAAWARVGLAVLGGAPFLGLLLVYNTHFFGSPFDLGYTLAWGDAHGLGFHRDPWGNLYSPVAAVAYTSADLTALSLSLFETPLPLVALVGLWLVFLRRLEPGDGVLLGWALAPVAANAFYWHHSYFMGPRMVAEAVPAWAGLTFLALVGLVRRAPEGVGSREVTGHVAGTESSSGAPGEAGLSFSPRTGLLTAFVLAALAAAYFAPLRLVNRGGEFHPSLRIEPPTPTGPALVFVHGGWSGRVFGRLAAAGLSMGSLETAIRQHDLCDLELMLHGDAVDTARLDLEPRPVTPGLLDVEVFAGNTITVSRSRMAPDGLDLPPACARQVRSDRHGIFDVAPLLWRGTLPGTGPGGPLYVRDLGPARNAALLAEYEGREPYVLMRERPGGRPVLVPYEQGMARLWEQPESDRIP